MALQQPKEQREHSRVALMFHTHVIDTHSDQPIGILSDISPEGMRVVGERGVAPGEAVEVRVPLPIEDLGSDELRFPCESRWSRRDPATDSIHTGFRLINLPDAQRCLLMSVIDEYGIENLALN